MDLFRNCFFFLCLCLRPVLHLQRYMKHAVISSDKFGHSSLSWRHISRVFVEELCHLIEVLGWIVKVDQLCQPVPIHLASCIAQSNIATHWSVTVFSCNFKFLVVPVVMEPFGSILVYSVFVLVPQLLQVCLSKNINDVFTRVQSERCFFRADF
jgi:hypothetical protein